MSIYVVQRQQSTTIGKIWVDEYTLPSYESAQEIAKKVKDRDGRYNIRVVERTDKLIGEVL